MSSPPLVSFITPAFNRPNELKTAIFSCLAQTINNWECIVVDDHSDKANLKELITNFKDERIRYIAQEEGKKGEASARQLAIENARSNVLITLDSDDINYPQRAARCHEILNSPVPKLLYTRVLHFSEQNPKGQKKKFLQPFNQKLLEMMNFITNPGTAFNVSAYKEAGAFYREELMLATDYDQFLRMTKAGVHALCLDEIHVCYRKHKDAVTAGSLNQLHQAIMAIRIKNNIQPFSLEEIKYYALPELSSAILNNKQQRLLWSDDRWETKDNG
tara:strand:- start:12 stop:833 length:822 start_codon:yes stop_codon:yes gene_type:complete